VQEKYLGEMLGVNRETPGEKKEHGDEGDDEILPEERVCS
jgi:hypothetical protein